LNWLPETEWDGGYHKLPQDHFDLFIYDTMFTEYYVSQQWLCTLNHNDFVYANEIHPNILSLICHDDKYYGIPIFACLQVLFYRTTDHELASMKTFDELMTMALKRDFAMRKPSGTMKTLNYLTIADRDHANYETLNRSLINRLSHFYRYAKCLLDKTNRYLFDQLSFYIGFTEDLNTMLIVNDDDRLTIDFMLLPLNNNQRPQCWLDCIGIHPQSKHRRTYDKSLQLANLMMSANVMNECLQGQLYVIPSNHVTLTHLASKNFIYAKLQALVESGRFRPSSSLPMTMMNSSISLEDQWSKIMNAIIAQHRKDMQLTGN
jgi:thiamine pyridinylase